MLRAPALQRVGAPASRQPAARRGPVQVHASEKPRARAVATDRQRSAEPRAAAAAAGPPPDPAQAALDAIRLAVLQEDSWVLENTQTPSELRANKELGRMWVLLLHAACGAATGLCPCMWRALHPPPVLSECSTPLLALAVSRCAGTCASCPPSRSGAGSSTAAQTATSAVSLLLCVADCCLCSRLLFEHLLELRLL